MDPEYFSKEITVAAYDCDVEGRMTPGAILRQAQQIAAEQCDALGGGTDVLAAMHCAFLLAKTSMELRAPIRAGQRLCLTTMPSAQQGAAFYRCTTLADETGAVLCLVDSRWPLVDTATRRICRRPPEGFPLHFTRPPAHVLPMKFERAETAQFTARETATYTRCDINRHMNNTRYADLVMDHIPLERLAGRSPAQLVIHYHNEIPLGTPFRLWGGETGPDTLYFCGEAEEGAAEKKYFEASVTLRADPA